jgi:hypothetical protein
MMRSWGNRSDTLVCDEPLYAHYLLKTGAPHPGVDEVLRHQENDWRKVVAWLTSHLPDGKSISYQKHMTHHLLPEIDRSWLDHVENVFLIREPKEVLTSLARVTPNCGLAETGLPQQVEIFDLVSRRTGRTPVVIDARDVLENPRQALQLLCGALGVEFMETMLAWPAGPRDTDGIWGKHWYDAVWQSTSFQPYQPKPQRIPDRLAGVLAEADRLYQRLYACKLRQ